MESQLAVIAGGHLSDLIHGMTDWRPGCANHQTLLTEAEIGMSLQANSSWICFARCSRSSSGLTMIVV